MNKRSIIIVLVLIVIVPLALAESLYGQPVAGVVGGLHHGGASAGELQPRIQFL